VLDDRTPEQILTDFAKEAKSAFNGELDFFEWRADYESHDFLGFMKRYLRWLEAQALRPELRANHARISATHVAVQGGRVAFQRKIFGTE